jgi:polyisoprenoid-binding protein YceI
MRNGKSGPWWIGSAIFAMAAVAAFPAAAQQTTLKFDPAKTNIKFSLDAVMHSVHGQFRLKPSELQFNPASEKLSGEILVDAKSGVTGNTMRDRKMHKDVLQSESYPEIAFLPDRVSGTVAGQGKSSVMVHGTFRIHGVDREVTVPAEVEMSADSWSATIHFTIPYAKWGMNNPSTLFLRVSDSVEIDVAAGGSRVVAAAASPAQ